MAIPGFQSTMLPLLKLAGDGEIHKLRDSVTILSEGFELTEDEMREPLPSGQQTRFQNRVGWARTHLSMAGLLESPKRGSYRITKRGLDVLNGNPAEINVKFLEQFQEYKDFRERRHTRSKPVDSNELDEGSSTATPEETLEDAYLVLKNDLAREILDKVKKSPPDFFERLVVELLVKIGYGGSLREAGKAIGGSGDEGIDGIIKEDRLGLDIIYVQAKRWEGTIGRPEVQKFAGALQGQRARKGVFIATSSFSADAEDFAANIETKIILIGGTELAELMIEHDVGVTTETTYELKRIDSDYFPDE